MTDLKIKYKYSEITLLNFVEVIKIYSTNFIWRNLMIRDMKLIKKLILQILKFMYKFTVLISINLIIFGDYIENIKNNFNITVTLHQITKLPNFKGVFIKVKRGKGGGEFICSLDYIYKNNIKFDNILFLQ